MASVQPVNAAIRVIELLQAMNRQPVCSIHWLYQATGMPKPTIVRLMQTLASRNIVRHAPQYGAYMLASEVTSLCSGYHGTPRLVDAGAGPWMRSPGNIDGPSLWRYSIMTQWWCVTAPSPTPLCRCISPR